MGYDTETGLITLMATGFCKERGMGFRKEKMTDCDKVMHLGRGYVMPMH
jgi:hypothetical protein